MKNRELPLRNQIVVILAAMLTEQKRMESWGVSPEDYERILREAGEKALGRKVDE